MIPAWAGYHTHIAEYEADQYDCLAKWNQWVVDRLEKRGILGEGTIAVHAAQVGTREKDRLTWRRTWFTHQPRSSKINGVGPYPVGSLVRVGLGKDGYSTAIWEESKAACPV